MTRPVIQSHPLEIKHHFGCCRTVVTVPLAEYARLVEIVQLHDCGADSDDNPNLMTQRAAPGDTLVSPDGC